MQSWWAIVFGFSLVFWSLSYSAFRKCGKQAEMPPLGAPKGWAEGRGEGEGHPVPSCTIILRCWLTTNRWCQGWGTEFNSSSWWPSGSSPYCSRCRNILRSGPSFHSRRPRTLLPPDTTLLSLYPESPWGLQSHLHRRPFPLDEKEMQVKGLRYLAPNPKEPPFPYIWLVVQKIGREGAQ